MRNKIKKFYNDHDEAIASFSVGMACSAVFFTVLAFKAVRANEIADVRIQVRSDDEYANEFMKSDSELYLTLIKANGSWIRLPMNEYIPPPVTLV